MTKKKKFKAKPFKEWLDTLCKVVVKTRDGFTCQKCFEYLRHSPHNCQWCHIKSRNRNNLRWDLYNAETLCGTCHQFVHANPDVGWRWLLDKWPDREKYLNDKAAEPLYTWREADFVAIEEYLLQKAIDFEVDYLDAPKAYRDRLKRKLLKIQERR
jgi:hypothetical protein